MKTRSKFFIRWDKTATKSFQIGRKYTVFFLLRKDKGFVS